MRAARVALVVFGSLVAIGALLAAVQPGVGTVAFLIAYDVVLGGIAVALAIALPRPTPSSVADLVIDFDDAAPTSMRERLARVLDDQGVRLAYWDAASGTFRDPETMRPRSTDRDVEAGRSTAVITRGRRPVAMVDVDANSPASAVLVEAIGTASAIDDEHERLGAEIRGRIDEVADARRRLARTADRERMELRARLRRTTEEPLEHLLASFDFGIGRPGGLEPPFERIEAMLRLALEELRDTAQGIRPAELDDGLSVALPVLASRSPLRVHLSRVTDRRFPPEVEAAVYFACSEALQNCAKHAGVDDVAMEVDDADGRLRVRIRDDGRGGAEVAGAGGLRGLVDRMRSVGGDARIESRPGRGTLVELSCEGSDG